MTSQHHDRGFRFPLEMGEIDFLSVLDRLDDGVLITDTKGTIAFYNYAQSKIDGLNPRDVVGLKVTDIYELNNHTSMVMQCVHRRASIKNRTFFYRTCSGKVANTITSVYPLLKGDDVNGVICFVKDYELLQASTPMASITQSRTDLGNGTHYTFADLIGNSPDFQRMVCAARKASSSSSPIMIQGETGTGKELFAQSIHNHSWRNKKKFVAVNCAAIPQDLLEGLLFGTTKGAFTGALDKAGLFEMANGGTLFLDELLSMPIALQTKLLRVIQEKSVRRVGSTKESPVDIKIISSVSNDPRQAVNNNLLRMDLFYRLGVVLLKLPPLRDRRKDMTELVFHFIEKINTLLGTRVEEVSPEVMDLFMTYGWPGNIRELEHLIEGAMNMTGHENVLKINHFSTGMESWEGLGDSPRTPGENIRFNATPSASSSRPEMGRVLPEFQNYSSDGPFSGKGNAPCDGFSRTLPSEPGLSSESGDVKIPLARNQAEQEKLSIKEALTASRGNVTRASSILGISRQLLHYKIKKHGLSRVDFMDR
ncbi:arginine utilization regulatory protein [Desulfocicer vacuolatum DSM 3385]|uniref:Arginine utilization regulatory protein n=1 Tax=Desulfocicer vacuolatum DSM 3385 TaxID=1121400 RepID=A0A1W2CTF9_9BACT|nr:sigma 54-interacting transcriptional regulator [Desulfocicer vacuolatum]SMC88172.1 arginine utilization regulatory protein [Desulfocicer vacuolatum DSM 3385]